MDIKKHETYDLTKLSRDEAKTIWVALGEMTDAQATAKGVKPGTVGKLYQQLDHMLDIAH